MAPRRRRPLGSSAAAAGAGGTYSYGYSYGLLLDEVVEKVLVNLEVQERARGAAQVNRQWRRVAWAPEPLKRVAICKAGSIHKHDLGSVFDWLASQAGPHAVHLRLHLPVVFDNNQVPRMRVTPPAQVLPQQLSALTALERLSMHLCLPSFSPDSMAVLSTLRNLRHLRLDRKFRAASRLPACLGTLTQLLSLHLHTLHMEDKRALVQALPRLQQLTALMLIDAPFVGEGRDVIQLAVDRLPNLQRLAYCCPRDATYGHNHMPHVPAGAWAGRLRWLGLESELLLKNPHLVQEAGQLEHLYILGSSSKKDCGDAWRALWQAAAHAASLSRIELHPSYGWVVDANKDMFVVPCAAKCMRNGLAELQRARPQLQFSNGGGTRWMGPAIWDVMFEG